MASDWDQRQLCPDGGCVGLIGSDGTCKVCGRAAPGWGEERTRGLIAEAETDAEAEAEAEAGAESGTEAEAGAESGAAATVGDSGGDFEERALCPDGGCIGVIGDDGACRVCGKRLDDGATAEA